jgi:hypothetical protein
MHSALGGLRPELVSLEMSGASASVMLYQGSMNIWFGRNVDKSTISRVLIIISKIDSTTEHQKEIFCKFEEISEFENNGYVLTSYARKGDKYRAIFVVPFSNSRALELFSQSISKELEQGEVRLTLYWRGGSARMNLMSQELSRLNCFDAPNATYKEDQPRDNPVKENIS